MIAVTLKGLAGRKLRASLTALAIVLGVAMVSGTYVLTDTISKGFDAIFADTYTHADAVIVGQEGFGEEGEVAAESYPADVLAKVRALAQVEGAEGAVLDDARLVGEDGKVIESSWGTAALSVDPAADRRFNPLTVVEGSWPRGGAQIAIDRATAKKQGLEPGDSIGVGALGPVQQFRISGIVEYGSVDSLGGAQIAAFDLGTAQKLFGKAGKLDEIQLRARADVSTRQLIESVRPLLPPTARVKTAAAQREAGAQGAREAVTYLGYFLLAFGAIALVVGGFVIANTLAITVAQRTRELATLRTLGASRRQVLSSVILEALVVGALASVAGVLVGLGLAKGLEALLDAVGVDLPASGTVLATRTIVVSLAVGILITLVASLRPALRATRVPAIAAVREGAVLPRSRLARLGPLPALAVGAVAVGVLAYGLFAGGLPAGRRLGSLAIGVLLLFTGVAMIAPRLIPPLAGVLGWPGTRLGGAAGVLARENARRNPGRTASTAAALMIGLALITFVATLGQGVRSSFTGAVDELFVNDYTLVGQDNFGATSVEASQSAAGAAGVRAVSEVRIGSGRAFEERVGVSGVEPDLAQVIHMRWKQGDAGVPARLGTRGAFVTEGYAEDHGLERGSPLRLQTPTGKTLALTVAGVFDEPSGGSPFDEVAISTAAFDSSFPQPRNQFAFVDVEGGVSAAATKRLEQALAAYPDTKVQTREQFKDGQISGLETVLNVLYALLGLSVLVSLFGIVNTLVLTVFERTRELGMLRAVGMTRRQVRRMVRHESIVTALMGTALGIGAGLFLAALVTRALADEGIPFAVPAGSLAAFTIAAVLIGILAAILPARRASRLNVLEALHYE
jgi:putative ABC transport system permease protein